VTGFNWSRTAGCLALHFERSSVERQDLVWSLFDACDAYSIAGIDVSRLGALVGADPATFESAWPELESALCVLVRAATREEERLCSKSLSEE